MPSELSKTSLFVFVVPLTMLFLTTMALLKPCICLFQKIYLTYSKMTDVFLMIRRKKSTIFLSCKETDTVAVLKKMLSGILRKEAEAMKIFQQCDNAEQGETPGM